MIREGTVATPLLVFGHNCDTGIFIKSKGVVAYSVDGIEVSLREFVDYCTANDLLNNLALIVSSMYRVTLGGDVASSVETPQGKD